MSNKLEKEMKNITIPEALHDRAMRGIMEAKTERQRPKSKTPFLLGSAVAVALALGIVVPFTLTDDNAWEQPEGGTSDAAAIVADASVIDMSNLRQVVGFSDSVFVGEVVEQAGTINEIYPETQFTVEVIESIKGDVSGTVTVNQAGGYEGDQLFLMDGDPLLEEGQQYIFATAYSHQRDWHSAVPVSGTVAINSAEERAKLTETYTEAYENEIPFEIDPGPGVDTGK